MHGYARTLPDLNPSVSTSSAALPRPPGRLHRLGIARRGRHQPREVRGAREAPALHRRQRRDDVPGQVPLSTQEGILGSVWGLLVLAGLAEIQVIRRKRPNSQGSLLSSESAAHQHTGHLLSKKARCLLRPSRRLRRAPKKPALLALDLLDQQDHPTHTGRQRETLSCSDLHDGSSLVKEGCRNGPSHAYLAFCCFKPLHGRQQ